MATQINLGDHFYLWLPAVQSNIIVISTHGAAIPERTFQMPANSTFKFYSYPESSAVSGLNKTLYPDQVKEEKTFLVGKPASWSVIDDYYLTKFQGTHGGPHGEIAETYNDIRRFVDDNGLNALTARNRTSIFVNKSAINHLLSTVVGLLDVGYNYIREFRCQFCRNSAW